MTAHEILKRYFGYDAFRGGQETLIGEILAGKDVFGIMPTGAGKSVCFQVPALMLPGITLVVSPLISLMKDQVNALVQSGVAAAFINSSLGERQIEKALKNAGDGLYKLIYVAPERLLSESFSEFAQSARISMLTVDEAHCISQWGHDFRPSYAEIPAFIESLKTRPVVSAFTATATLKVREDVIGLLRLKAATVLATGFDRPNLYFEVLKPKDKLSALQSFLRDREEQSGIVYCATRAAVEEVAESLRQRGYGATRYHAGLSDTERHENQDDFIFDRARVMVATNAFGMGIDKSNVSFVAHYNMPKDIESYYQEAGRAGRDGSPADCVLLYSGQDVRTNLWLIENARDAENGLSQEESLERQRGRLREMAFYCATSDCLRGYILKYFGETPPPYCGNCGSCNTHFETVDVTVEAKKVLSCVARMKGRYGVKMIVDTLRGSKNERVLRLGLDQLSTYGISELGESQLRAVISHLILSGCLIKTDDEYPVIKLGKAAGGVLYNGEPVSMKLPREPARTAQKPEKPAWVKPVDKRLLDALRAVRLAAAKEQNVPAFVIFPDSTLTDMCIKMPQNQEELLAVTGVGRVKAQRYGSPFLEAIERFVTEHALSQDAEPSGEADPAAAPKDLDFTRVELTEEPVTVSAIADRINCVLLESGRKKISGKRINDWLVSCGYLTLITENDKPFKVPTEAGIQLGIVNEDRVIRGEAVKLNLFARKAQEFVVLHGPEI